MNSYKKVILVRILILLYPLDVLSYQDDSQGIQKEIIELNNLTARFFKSQIDSSLYYANLALNKSKEISYIKGEIDACCDLGFAYYIKNDLENSVRFNQLAFDLSDKESYKLGKAKSLNNFGLLEWRKGAYSEALNNYKAALAITSEINNDEEKSRSLNFIGLVYWKIGNYPASVESLFGSLKIKEKLNDQYEIALTLNNLSNVYNEMGNYDKAISFAKRALEITEKTGNNYAIGRAYGNLGVSYSKTNNYQTAIDYLTKALEIKQKSGEIKGLAYTLMDIATLYSKQNNILLSLEYYNKALDIMKSINDAHGLALSYYSLAELYYNKGDYSKTFYNINKSMQYAKRENLRESIKNNLFLLSRYYEKSKNYARSLEYFQAYSNLKDSLLSEINNSQIANLQVKYETTQKEKENELLKQKNIIQSLELNQQESFIKLLVTIILLAVVIIFAFYYKYKFVKNTKRLLEEKNSEIEKQKHTLEELNNTKDKLFSIIAHDLKNPFQSILGNTSLLIEEYKALSETERMSIISQIDTVTKSSYVLLENLLHWSLSETGQFAYSPTNINLRREVDETLSLLSAVIEKKNLKVDLLIDHSLEVFTDSNFLRIILRNLVTNAVKYSYTNGKIKVESRIDDNNVIVMVEDHGIGMTEEETKKLFTIQSRKSVRGTSNERGTGLGLIVSNECVQKYGGQIRAESILGEGSRFYFTIPRSNI